MTFGEIIQRIKSAKYKGVHKLSSRLTSRHIYSKLLTVRSLLLVQKVNKRQKISSWNFQEISCIELVKAPPHDCPCLPPIGCEILKSKYKLPKPLTGLSNHIIDYVSTVDGTVFFDETDWKGKKNKKGNKYTSRKPDYYFKDGHIIVTHTTGLKAITLRGLFQDPLEVYKYPTMCGTKEEIKCVDPLEMEFPLDADLIDTLIEMSVSELFYEGRQQDPNNNSNQVKQ